MNERALSPVDIQLKKGSALVNITWTDGSKSCLSGAQLRQFCACSSCRARNVVGVAMITDSDRIEDLKLMGDAGLQIVFSDGHDRGVFPWAYLQAIANGNALEHLQA